VDTKLCRLWTSQGARYAGFLGQWRPLTYTLRTNQNESVDSANCDSVASTNALVVLPYDITESPMPARKTDSARRSQLERLRLQSRLEYPVLFDNTRWIPLTVRSTTHSNRHKFFDALVKPSVSKLIKLLDFCCIARIKDVSLRSVQNDRTEFSSVRSV